MNTSRYKSDEIVKKHVIEMMGDELGALYHELGRELSWVYLKWNEYVELFGTNPKRIELINRAASTFFWIIEQTLWEDILLHIARLTDKPISSSKKENLTIQKLPVHIGNEGLKNKVSELIKISIEKSDFCRDWRNRYIAHRDFDLAMQKNVMPLKQANREKVIEALESLETLMNELAQHYLDEINDYKHIAHINGAISLLYVISDGLKVEQDRNKRLSSGIFREEDLITPDI